MTTEVLEIEARLKDFLSVNFDTIIKKMDELGKAEEEVGKKSKESSDQMAFGMLKAEAVIQGVKIAMEKLKNFTVDAAMAFGEEEDAVARLNATLRATNGAVGLTSDSMVKFARELQNVTRFSDDTTISAQALLTSFRGISGDVFNRTIVQAQNMASALGMDLRGAVMQLGSALSSPTEGLMRLSRAGVRFTDEQKKRIESLIEEGNLYEAQSTILKEIEFRFGGVAEAMAKTDLGQLEIMKNKLDDIKEDLGREIMPAMLEWNELWYTMAQGAMYFFNQLKPATETSAERMLEIDLEVQQLKKDLVDAPEKVDAFTKAFDGLFGKEDQIQRGRAMTKTEINNAIAALSSEREQIVQGNIVKKNAAKQEEELARQREAAAKAAQDAYAAELKRSALLSGKDKEKKVPSWMVGSPTDISQQRIDYDMMQAEEYKATMAAKQKQFDEMEDLQSFFLENEMKMKKDSQDKWYEEQTKNIKSEGELFQQRLDLAQDFSNRVGDIFTGIHQIRMNQIEKERDAELQKVERSTMSEKQKQKLTEQINAKFEAERQKAAKAEKATAIGMAIINTALGVTKALSSSSPPVNFILAALTAAAGAVQIATIASQKLAVGSSRAQGGMALVGELGPELVMLPHGSRIYSALETRNLTNNINNSTTTNTGNNQITVNVSDAITGERIRNMLRAGELDNFIIDLKKRGQL